MLRTTAATLVLVVLSASVSARQTAPATSGTTPTSSNASPPSSPSSPSTGSKRSLFGKLFHTLGRDLKELPSRENASVLLTGAIVATGLLPVDDEATLAASSSPALKRAFSGWGKALGREWVQGGGALAAYTAGTLWKKPRMTEIAGDLIEAQIVAVTVTQGLKFAFRRDRPDREARSFPSGHASAAFATARVLQRHLGKRAAIPAYLVAAYTSASRLQANSHFASDVVFGAALGLAIAHTATASIGSHQIEITPAATASGVQLELSWR